MTVPDITRPVWIAEVTMDMMSGEGAPRVFVFFAILYVRVAIDQSL